MGMICGSHAWTSGHGDGIDGVSDNETTSPIQPPPWEQRQSEETRSSAPGVITPPNRACSASPHRSPGPNPGARFGEQHLHPRPD
ncbi:hypothetical protein SKAU_G00331820 [Synaphobranchus kaupii]|uniref:Uncharacterized protein n=1 Tax=Synaphobranchus kaupii TaxID=118154 RepID=A0A9Q1IIJ9_SYNKA|nr:hypothetical protein SKAU_G00331820 [Synaphobranchus kaupii]